ncbi:hypothetical protein SFUMM280S_06832 [Streptomyces fumanus]
MGEVELADEPVHAEKTWVSSYEIDPFAVPDAEKSGLLAEWSARLLAARGVDHVDASLLTVHENKFYADTAGTVTTQQRVRLHPVLTAVSVDDSSGEFDSMRTLAPPAGRGWEYLTGTGWDWDAELAEIPELLAEKMRAPSVTPGLYDLVIDPSNLWLTIHESIGHATELDRALGYEAAYAGTSFATFDRLGTLRYGSELMNVTGDRTAEHGLATIGYDDEGVEAQSWDLVKDGTLVGYQLDRRIARLTGFERSNACAYADSPSHVPVQRMANVSLRPDPAGLSTQDLIGVERGIYVVGDRSWSIDMQRYSFQFTGQRFFRIEREAGRAGAGRRLPGDDHRLLAAAWRQIEPFLSFEGENAATMVNNLDWTSGLSAIEFLRDVGKHFRVNKMLTKDSVARRLESSEGISYTEFSYQLLQALDFLQLYRRYGCVLQQGGSDQWGNLTAGLDLIHRLEPDATVHAYATPLMTKADGTSSARPRAARSGSTRS